MPKFPFPAANIPVPSCSVGATVVVATATATGTTQLHSRKRKLESSPSIVSMDSATSTSSSSSFTKRKRPRRRVHIHPLAATSFHEPLHKVILPEHKPHLWYTQEDFTMTLMDMRKAIQSAQRFAKGDMEKGQEETTCVLASTLPLYGESLASTYLACCVDEGNNGSGLLPSTITHVHLEQLGAGGHHCRGMETCALPDLAAERSAKRREIIQNVVLFHRTFAPILQSGQRDECLRSISEQLTAPSRKFAQAMGMSDTLSALKTYTESVAIPSESKQRQPAAKGA